MCRVYLLPALAALSFLLPVRADAEYRRMSRIEVIARAEVIVMGTVTQVDESTVNLRVDHSIHGSVVAGQTIVVDKFHNWACAWRWGPYYVGERLLMFLVLRDDIPDRYHILGAGDEGESPIYNGKADAYEDVPDKAHGWEDNNNGPLALGSLAQVRAAIRDLRFAYRFTFADPPRYVPGGWGEYAVFDRIDRVTMRPASGEFKKRYPPGMEVPYRQFEHRSPVHGYPYKQIQTEKRRTQAAPPNAQPASHRPNIVRSRVENQCLFSRNA